MDGTERSFVMIIFWFTSLIYAFGIGPSIGAIGVTPSSYANEMRCEKLKSLGDQVVAYIKMKDIVLDRIAGHRIVSSNDVSGPLRELVAAGVAIDWAGSQLGQSYNIATKFKVIFGALVSQSEGDFRRSPNWSHDQNFPCIGVGHLSLSTGFEVDAICLRGLLAYDSLGVVVDAVELQLKEFQDTCRLK